MEGDVEKALSTVYAVSQLEFRSRNFECLINLNILAFSRVKFSSCDKADHFKLKGRVSKDL